MEMLADVPDLDVIVVPIGGGGVIGGIAIAAKALNPRVEIIGVEAQLYPLNVPSHTRSGRNLWRRVHRGRNRSKDSRRDHESHRVGVCR